MSWLQDFLVREHRRALDGMLQLAHVARPALRLEPRQRVVTQDHGPPEAAGESGRKVARQWLDVGPPLRQRRQMDGDDVEAVVQVLAEPAGSRLGLEITRRGR